MNNKIFLAIILIIFGVSLRLFPHPPNFAPIAAIAIFSGAYLGNRKCYFLIPLTAMFVSDLFIGFPEFWVSLSVYSSFAFIWLIGKWYVKNKGVFNLIGASLLSSVTFFLITNFVVWAATPWYNKNIKGLSECFFMALPFFRNTILGDFFFVGIIFGAYQLSMYISKKQKLVLTTKS